MEVDFGGHPQRCAKIGLFAELEAGLNGGADNVVVAYDPTYGFPTEITLDFEEQAADDELYLSISDFEALP